MNPIPKDEELFAAMYRTLAAQPESVETMLRRVRTQHNQSEIEQQADLQASPTQFTRLRAFMRPRPPHFVEDARLMAVRCGLPEPEIFISLLLEARNLLAQDRTEPKAEPTPWSVYRAAHPAEEDDEPPPNSSS